MNPRYFDARLGRVIRVRDRIGGTQKVECGDVSHWQPSCEYR